MAGRKAGLSIDTVFTALRDSFFSGAVISTGSALRFLSGDGAATVSQLLPAAGPVIAIQDDMLS